MLSGIEPLLIPTLTAAGQILIARRPFAGDFPAVSPGDTRMFGIDFTRLMAPGDSLVTAIGETAAYYNEDPNADLLPEGPCYPVGAIALQTLGGEDGFQPCVIYRWSATVTTGFGATITAYGHIYCSPIN